MKCVHAFLHRKHTAGTSFDKGRHVHFSKNRLVKDLQSRDCDKVARSFREPNAKCEQRRTPRAKSTSITQHFSPFSNQSIFRHTAWHPCIYSSIQIWTKACHLQYLSFFFYNDCNYELRPCFRTQINIYYNYAGDSGLRRIHQSIIEPCLRFYNTTSYRSRRYALTLCSACFQGGFFPSEIRLRVGDACDINTVIQSQNIRVGDT